MLRISKSIMALFAVIVFVISVPVANAMTLGFATYSLSGEEKAESIKKINLELIHDDSNRAGIQCFDVSQNGSVALAFQSGSRCLIYVYNAAGAFQYGFMFFSDGDFGIEFYQEYLAIYFIRGNSIAIYDSEGNCIDIQKELNPNQNLGRTKEILNRTLKEVDGKQYILERDVPLGDSYSRCVVVDTKGTRTVLYDNSTTHSTAQIVRLVAFVSFFVFVAWGAYKKLKQAEE